MSPREGSLALSTNALGPEQGPESLTSYRRAGERDYSTARVKPEVPGDARYNEPAHSTPATDQTMPALEDRIKEQARRLGFELAGIAAATPADGFDRFLHWLEAGHAGEMGYMNRHAEARRHPEAILPGVRSVVML